MENKILKYSMLILGIVLIFVGVFLLANIYFSDLLLPIVPKWPVLLQMFFVQYGVLPIFILAVVLIGIGIYILFKVIRKRKEKEIIPESNVIKHSP